MNTTLRTETPALITLMEHWAKTVANNGDVAAVTIQEGADRLRELQARAEKAEAELVQLRAQEGDYIKIIAEVLECEQRPACEQPDNQLEAPWEVVARLRAENDEMRVQIEANKRKGGGCQCADDEACAHVRRAERAEIEAQLWHNRFASILWSGALNKHTGEDFQKWEAEFKAEQNALIARAEKAEMLLKQSPHWDIDELITRAEKAEEQFKIDDGGNAFPYLESDSNGQYRHHYGMTMRDYFMAHAPNVPDSFERKSELKEVHVPAPEAGRGWVKCGTRQWVEDDLTRLVRWRTTYADAMLAARKEVTK